MMAARQTSFKNDYFLHFLKLWTKKENPLALLVCFFNNLADLNILKGCSE